MNTDTLTCAIIGHLVGDYLLQNDWMALNKKKDPLICALHCIIWAYCVCCFAGFWPTRACSVLVVTHFIQDHTNIVAWWMRLKWKDQSQFMRTDTVDAQWYDTNMKTLKVWITPGLGPWSIIVVDNVWHIVTIWAVWKWVV